MRYVPRTRKKSFIRRILSFWQIHFLCIMIWPLSVQASICHQQVSDHTFLNRTFVNSYNQLVLILCTLMSFYDRALRKPLNSRWHLTMNLAVLGSWSLRKAKSSVHNCKASSQSLSAFAFFSSFAQPLSRVRLLTFFSMQWLCMLSYSACSKRDSIISAGDLKCTLQQVCGSSLQALAP